MKNHSYFGYAEFFSNNTVQMSYGNNHSEKAPPPNSLSINYHDYLQGKSWVDRLIAPIDRLKNCPFRKFHQDVSV